MFCRRKVNNDNAKIAPQKKTMYNSPSASSKALAIQGGGSTAGSNNGTHIATRRRLIDNDVYRARGGGSYSASSAPKTKTTNYYGNSAYAMDSCSDDDSSCDDYDDYNTESEFDSELDSEFDSDLDDEMMISDGMYAARPRKNKKKITAKTAKKKGAKMYDFSPLRKKRTTAGKKKPGRPRKTMRPMGNNNDDDSDVDYASRTNPKDAKRIVNKRRSDLAKRRPRDSKGRFLKRKSIASGIGRKRY